MGDALVLESRQAFIQNRAELRREIGGERLAGDLAGLATEHSLGRLVEQRNPPFPIDDDDDDRVHCRAEDAGEALLALAQRLFGLQPIRQVTCDRHAQPAFISVERANPNFDWKDAPILPPVHALQRVRLPLRDLPQYLVKSFVVQRNIDFGNRLAD